MKTIIAVTILLLSTKLSFGQKNFSGTWSDPKLEMINGKQYSNAVPKEIKVTQTKDSIKLVSVETDDKKFTQTIALNGKTAIRVGKTSKRTIRTTATWSGNGKILTFVNNYSYADNPGKLEYTNTEVWKLSEDGTLVIEKTSDADVTDDWNIKAVYSKR